MKQNTHFVVQQQNFELLQGQEHLTFYQVLSISFGSEQVSSSDIVLMWKDVIPAMLQAYPLVCLQFNTMTAKHSFCKTCGVQSFYTPRSNPDGYAVTVACIDPGTLSKVVIQDVDGKNWEKVFREEGFVALS